MDRASENSQSEKKLKLLVDCSPLHQGGGVQVALGFLHFAKDDPAFEILVVLPTSLLPVFRLSLGNEIKIICVQKNSFFKKILLTIFMKNIEKNFGADIVFTVFGPSYFTAKSFHIIGFALGLLIYPPIWRKKKKKIMEFIMDYIKLYSFFRADLLITETETVARRLTARLKNLKTPITVIKNSYNPIFFDAFIKKSSRKNSRTDFFNIFIPSSWYIHKNLFSIPELAFEMKKMNCDFDFLFTFTLDENSSEWNQIRDRSFELGIADKLATIGNLEMASLANAYLASDVVYLPTLCESSTAVYPESFLAHKPLVTTDLDFAHELCGEAALYVDPADHVETANRIAGLLASETLQRRLVDFGSTQLKRMYPSPIEKYHKQRNLILDCYSLKD
jgi:glycosyltransferase involved in cell wall biosynthesis